MYQTKNLGLNITEIDKDKLQPFSFKLDLGDNFEAIDEKTLSHRNITNCLLEVPQDIKLDIADGVLTLKEGSKVYVPNGVGVFDEVVIAEDISNSTVGNGDILIAVGMNNSLLALRTDGVTVTERPESPEDFVLYYNTTTNKAEIYDTTWFSDCSLPIAIVERTTNGFTNIKQVFNGFGYIGSTIFALPGVKCLIPNGRNEDGSLNNTIHVVPSVATYTWNSSYSGTFENLILTNNQIAGNGGWAEYKEKENLLWNKDTNTSFSGTPIVDLTISTGQISSFTPKTPFHAVDHNDYQTKITELESKIVALEAAVKALQG